MPVEDWTACAQTHTQIDRQTKVKAVYPPVSLRSLGYKNLAESSIVMIRCVVCYVALPLKTDRHISMVKSRRYGSAVQAVVEVSVIT